MINEQDLPGIGRRYEIVAARGQRVVLIVHHSGRRDLYIMERHREDPACVVELTDDQARRIGAILSGVFFKPTVVEEIERIMGEFIVDWITVDEDAPAVGRSLADLEVRRRSGMSVIAIVRGKHAITAPDPDETLQAGDRLVAVGLQEDLPRLIELVMG
jgi:TrkA domain protein